MSSVQPKDKSFSMTHASHPSLLENFKGALFDLDGVITNTAKIHAKAWKLMFDDFLREYGSAHDQTFQPLSIEEDYPRYIDGKPRLEGVKSFLEARSIELPYGDPEDEAGEATINGLGKRKNNIFRELLEQEPIAVYHTNIDTIIEWRKAGIKTAVISSSKNCALILEKTSLNSLFDVRVDGVIADQNGLNGKPHPDFFTEGANQLGLEPSECIVFEDAISGVQAGNEGNFGLVVGVTTTNNKAVLIKNGADIAVNNLDELNEHLLEPRHLPEKLANAIHGEFLERILADKEPALFLDYDGTLTPIVNRPEDAALPESTREILRILAAKIPVAIISGRDRSQVEGFVGIDDIYYAGSHGFDIAGPNGLNMEVEKAQAILPHLNEAEKKLNHQTQGLSGVQIERKRFAIAIHFRNAPESMAKDLKTIVDQVANHYSNLKLSGGKKVFELKPNIDWDKGKAVDWLLNELNLNQPHILPFYIGDDLTDEDAFRNLIHKGIGILVGDHGYRTFAQYYLEDPWSVEKLLSRINTKLEALYE